MKTNESRIHIDLQLQELKDEKVKAPEWIQVIREGEFNHFMYGDFSVTSEKIDIMISNFKKKTRTSVAVDYGHDAGGAAAGWIQKLESRGEGKAELWAKIKWTPKGKEAVENQEYRFVSADFSENYKSSEKPYKDYGCVLLGCALTNRPFVQKMNATTELSEINGGKKMDFEKKLAELEVTHNELVEKHAKLSEDLETVSKTNADLLTENETIKKELSDANELIVLKEKEKQFSDLLTEGKVVPAQKDAFMKNDLIEFAAKASTQELNLSEKGSSTIPEEKTDLEKKFDAEIEKLMKEKSMNYSDALSMVCENDTELSAWFKNRK